MSDFSERLDAVERAVIALAAEELGAEAGHPFYGNQYSGGGGGGEDARYQTTQGKYSPAVEANAMLLGTHHEHRVHQIDNEGKLPYYSRADESTLTHEGNTGKSGGRVVGTKEDVEAWAALREKAGDKVKVKEFEPSGKNSPGNVNDAIRATQDRVARSGINSAIDRAIRVTGSDPSWYGR